MATVEAPLDFLVVVNHEQQYSAWPATHEVPAGWQPAGATGTREECLTWIGQNWTDMRPLSLRKALEH